MRPTPSLRSCHCCLSFRRLARSCCCPANTMNCGRCSWARWWSCRPRSTRRCTLHPSSRCRPRGPSGSSRGTWRRTSRGGRTYSRLRSRSPPRLVRRRRRQSRAPGPRNCRTSPSSRPRSWCPRWPTRSSIGRDL